MYAKVCKKKLGEVAKISRKQAGYTQSDIAKEIGCDIRSISLFECGYTTSFRVLSWYIQNNMLNNDKIRGCIVNGETQ